MRFGCVHSARDITNQHPTYTEHSHRTFNHLAKYACGIGVLYLFSSVYSGIVNYAFFSLKQRLCPWDSNPREIQDNCSNLDSKQSILQLPSRSFKSNLKDFQKNNFDVQLLEEQCPTSAENTGLSGKLLLTSYTNLSSTPTYSLL